LPVIESLEGRLDDLIITKDGRFIGRIDEAFHDSFGIKMSQIVQKKAGQIVVRIVKTESFSSEDLNKLDYQLRKRLGQDMEIRYEFVDEVQLVGSGKYRFVISEIDIARLYHEQN
jgi:phenylacetate-CoA ligase